MFQPLSITDTNLLLTKTTIKIAQMKNCINKMKYHPVTAAKQYSESFAGKSIFFAKEATCCRRMRVVFCLLSTISALFSLLTFWMYSWRDNTKGPTSFGSTLDHNKRTESVCCMRV